MKILDCTLRDGGYYTNWDFDDDLVKMYVKALSVLPPVEFIELGYASKEKEGYLGKYFYTSYDTIKKLRNLAPNKKISLMINAKDCFDIDIAKLLSSYINNVDLIRIAAAPDKIKPVIRLAKQIRDLGFLVSLNLMQISKIGEDHQILGLLPEIEKAVDILYLVDSYGGMYPDELKNFINRIKERTKMKLGFHGHNNLELAFANTLAAVEEGIEIIDSTILGVGRGAGNLKTELILSYIQKKESGRFDFSQFSEVLSEFERLQEKYKWGTNFAYITSGTYSLPQKDVMEWINKRRYSIHSVVLAMDNQRKKASNNQKIKNTDQLVKQLNFDKNTNVVVIGGGMSAVKHNEAIKKLIVQENMPVVHSSTRNLRAYEDLNKEQLLCLSGNEGYKLNKIINENIKKSINAYILSPSPRVMGTYIPEFIRDNIYELKKIDFTKQYQDAPLAISLQLALELKAKEILLVGFDGYSSPDDVQLTNENQVILNAFVNNFSNIYSITPTSYHNVKERSVYSLLTI